VNYHTAKTATPFLQNVFGDRIVGHGFWPPRPPEPTSPEFFLLEFFKERVYSNKTRGLEDIKHDTEGALTNKLLDVLEKKKVKIANACFQRSGQSSSMCVIARCLSYSC
jgi:hypothetical protein